MPQPAQALPPHWLDGVIESVLDTGDESAIANAIAQSPQFLDAIRAGLQNKPRPGVMGPSYAQNIRREIQKAMA